MSIQTARLRNYASSPEISLAGLLEAAGADFAQPDGPDKTVEIVVTGGPAAGPEVFTWRTKPAADAPAVSGGESATRWDAQLTASEPVLRDLLTGKTTPYQEYAAGRLQLRGSTPVALHLLERLSDDLTPNALNDTTTTGTITMLGSSSLVLGKLTLSSDPATEYILVAPDAPATSGQWVLAAGMLSVLRAAYAKNATVTIAHNSGSTAITSVRIS